MEDYDKEYEHRLTKIEYEVAILKEREQAWASLVRFSIKKLIQGIVWSIGLALSGILCGWHLPEEVRKRLSTLLDWLAK